MEADATMSPFARLPDEIIEQSGGPSSSSSSSPFATPWLTGGSRIILATDANGFASLVVVNSKWRAVSQRPHLYLHHLARCPSFLSSRAEAVPAGHGCLPRLRRLFAREAKRCLFDAYLRPHKTTVNLVSNSISSSSCPGGEGMQFAASPSGHHLLAYNSSRIYVIDLRGHLVQVKRQLKIVRRPVSACVTDDASLLAVLSTEVQVDLYDLRCTPARRKRSLLLDNCPRTIALSSCGSVLAAAYEAGIQVSSLDPGALPTDKRAVKCDVVDALVFSLDGTQILGTTTCSSSPSTVVLTAPYYDPASQPADTSLAAMWTTSILFPNTSRDCSHAILLPRDGHRGELEWTFTYDRSLEAFHAVRLDDLRNGTTYFTGPLLKPASPCKLLPCTLPASAARGNEVWIYGVPGDLDAVPDTAISHEGSSDSSTFGRHSGLQAGLSRHASSARAHDSDSERVPQWQLLCDRLRNNLVTGCKLTELAGVSNVQWVAGFAGSALRERLVVTARGVTGPRLATEEEDIDFVDGGRIALIDFDYGLVDGIETEVLIEVGTDEAEVLDEATRDIAAEVALAGQRTVAQRQRVRKGARRPSLADAAGEPLSSSPASEGDMGEDPLIPRAVGKNPAIRRLQADESSMDELEALDVPYEHASPRSGTTLRRAATAAAAANRRLNPRTADGRPIQYRRADGRTEHPHESDAANWVPPPPYQKEDPGDLPAFLRGPSVPPPTGSLLPPPPSFPPPDGHCLGSSSPSGQDAEAEAGRGQRRQSRPRLASVSTASSQPADEGLARPTSSPSMYSGHVDLDDIYDVSPQGSTRLSACLCDSHRPPGSTGVPREGSTSSANAQPAFASSGTASTGPTADGRDASQGHVPLSLFNIHRVSLSHSMPASATERSPRRPSNAQTWPSETAAAASMRAVTGRESWLALPGGDGMALPPSPSPELLASLDRRPSRGTPRPLLGGVRSRSASARPADQGRDGDGPRDRGADAGMQMPEFDCPLIISTPKGVVGALDFPSPQESERRDEPQILAPVPRHPRPTQLNHSYLVLESLEHPSRQGARSHRRSSSPQRRQRVLSGLPVWLRAGPAGASRSPTMAVHRRASRAERSAAKNMLDAQKRGWTGQRKGGKKRGGRGERGAAAYEASSSAGWADMSTPSGSKDKKCALM